MFDMKWAEGRTVTKASFCPGLPPGSSIASQKHLHFGGKKWADKLFVVHLQIALARGTL